MLKEICRFNVDGEEYKIVEITADRPAINFESFGISESDVMPPPRYTLINEGKKILTYVKLLSLLENLVKLYNISLMPSVTNGSLLRCEDYEVLISPKNSFQIVQGEKKSHCENEEALITALVRLFSQSIS